MEHCLHERNACMDFISLTVITFKRSKRVNQVIPGVQQPSSSVVYCAPTHNFDCFVLFFNTPHTISTTTHPMSKTPQIHCKMKQSCKNYTLIYQNHILLAYATHAII